MSDQEKFYQHLLSEIDELKKKVTLLEVENTEYRKSSESYAVSAEKYRLMFENIQDGVSVYEEFEDPKDPDNRKLIECNARYAEMSGRSREELLRIGRTSQLQKPLTPHDFPSIVQGIAFRGMFSWIRPDGKENVNEYTAVPIMMHGKKFTIGIDRDITVRINMEKELQQARAELELRVENRTKELLQTNEKLKKIVEEHQKIEEALKHEKVLLDALMDTIPDSIYFKDKECRLLRVNRKEMVDLKIDDMDQITGKTDIDLFGEEFGQKTLLDDKKLIESGKSIIGLIESRHLPNGRINWTLTTKVPLRDLNGAVVGLVGITREINELMQAQMERDRVIAELQEALAEIKTLSGLVPICASCKKVRDDKGYWTQVESYIQERSKAQFSHGICPDCMIKLYPDFKSKAISGQ